MSKRRVSLIDLAEAAQRARDEYAAQIAAHRELRLAAAAGHSREVALRRRYASALRDWKVAEADEMARNPPDDVATVAEAVVARNRAELLAAEELADAEAEMAQAAELVRL